MLRLGYRALRISQPHLPYGGVHGSHLGKTLALVRGLSSHSTCEIKYPDGKELLTKTASSSNENHVTLEELIDKKNLRKLFLATYQLEIDWLLSKLPRSIPICLARNWDRLSGEQPGISSLHSNFTVVHPPLSENQYGSMHAKLFILYYDEFIRVVVTSANMTSLDWETFENAIFVQDFSRARSEAVRPCAFGRDLYHFLGALRIPNFIRNTLTGYDFSTAKVTLIPSVPGAHLQNQEEVYGHKKIAQALMKHGLMSNCSDNKMTLEYQVGF
ncbi:phospholipase D/nuclease [Basidiobolus meristosporus CBS 931.73]|uniref:Phospholipase D/nuclease n=1 Tax=Basidiobolus meristosporus CBS 931.73 TaxID=1314790 RepID=A0A1Y1VUF2_9FUNG|nr:phospholipase D/nuclease [Basidiobolus meristosporus CBS 931.73]|eukprot:ORX64917.1 phospholipase D/nuclease [Basidiobolus meristosporus CBS 931.73]